MAGTLTPEAGQASFAQPVADNSLGQALTGLGNTLFSGRSSSNTPTEGAKNRELSKVLARDIRRAGGDPGKEGIVIRNYLQYGGDLDANTKALLESQTGKSFGNIGVTPEQVAQKAVEESYAYNRKTEAYSTAILAGYYTLPANATNADRDQNALAYVAKQAAYNATWAAAGQELTPSLTSAASAKLTDQVSAWTGALILKENSGQQVVKEDLIGARAQLDNFRMELMAQPAFMNASEDNKGKKALVAQMDAVGKRLTELEKLASTENLTNMRAQRYVETLKASFMADGVLNNDENLALMFYSDPKNLGQNPAIFNGVLSTISGAAAGDGTLPNPSISMDGTNIRIMGVGLPTETTLAAIKAKDPAVDTWQVVVEAATSLKNIDTTTYANDEIAKAALLAHANISAGLNHMDGFLSGPKARDTFDQNFIDNAQATFKANPTVGVGLSQQYQEGIAKLIVATDTHRKSIVVDSLVIQNADGSLTINNEYLATQGQERIGHFNEILTDVYKGSVEAFAKGKRSDYWEYVMSNKTSAVTASDFQMNIARTLSKQVDVVATINYLNKVKNGLKYEDPKAIAKDAVEAVEAAKGAITQTVIPDVGTGPAEISSYVTRGTLKPVLNEGEGKVSSMTKPEAYSNMKTVLEGPFRRASVLFGGPLTVNDGIAKEGTSREKNRKGSQHFEGTALDISIAGMSDDDKLRLVDSLEKAGFQGLGFGKTIIHADMGKRRSWHYFGEGNDSAVFAGGKTVGELINTHNGLTIPREGSYKTSEGNSGSAIEPDNDSDHGEGEPSGFAMGSTAPMSSPRPQGRPQSDPALSGVIPEEVQAKVAEIMAKAGPNLQKENPMISSLIEYMVTKIGDTSELEDALANGDEARANEILQALRLMKGNK
jgi:hypothetical protein